MAHPLSEEIAAAVKKPWRVPRRVARLRQATALAVIALLGCAVAIGMPSFGVTRGAVRREVQADATRRTPKIESLLLPAPHPVPPFHTPSTVGEGVWRATGRRIGNQTALYETTLRLPDNAEVVAGVAWMDTDLLRARLYSGSLSPGGLFWKYTAPISPLASRTLVAAFNGGFLLKDAGGGYLSEGHLVAPLRPGAASLVIYKSGMATVGTWGRDVTMTPSVVAVRQNLTLIVDHGQPVPGLNPADIYRWGSSFHQIPNTWRSALGVTPDGALVYVAGAMNIVDLANILVRVGAIRAMTLDMNPAWTVFASYAPANSNGVASPVNGTDLLWTMFQTPARFFEPVYSRDFVTMSTP